MIAKLHMGQYYVAARHYSFSDIYRL